METNKFLNMIYEYQLIHSHVDQKKPDYMNTVTTLRKECIIASLTLMLRSQLHSHWVQGDRWILDVLHAMTSTMLLRLLASKYIFCIDHGFLGAAPIL